MTSTVAVLSATAIVFGYVVEAKATAPGENGRIVFRRYLDATRTTGALFTIRPDGTGLRHVTHPPPGVIDQYPDWSPDGRSIVFHRMVPCTPGGGGRDGMDGTCDRIYTVRPDGKDLKSLVPCGFDASQPYPGSCVGAHTPAWSADGSKIAFSYSLVNRDYAGSLNLQRGIWIVNADGTERRQLTQLTPGSSWDDEPQWSPDGRKLVFVRVDLQRKQDAVFTVNVDGSDLFQVTPWALNGGTDPEWSPDGRWIVFTAHPRDGSENVHKVHPDGTGLVNLTRQGRGGHHYLSSSFSPDGTMIVTARTPGAGSKGAADLVIMKADGSEIRPLTKTSLWESSVDWGPIVSLQPGTKVRGMTLTSGTSARADVKLFDHCDPVILQPGSYQRSCSVPRVRRLFIGYGAFDADHAKLDADWKASRWHAWLDGQPIALPTFGTLDRILAAFPPAGGRDATLREWRVTLVNATRGRHTVRYRLEGPVTGVQAGTIDATFTFRVIG